ncbi:MAG: hypothetical protein M3Q30_13795 [Actinomycetota bacterium]|nr:hypothetical protein [Actinomycetota bacterium]
MTELDRALVDLAGHLDHPTGDGLIEAVRRRIAGPVLLAERTRNRARSLLTLAAVLVLIVAAVVTISPARRAIADWLGIGAVEIRRSDRPLPTGPPELTIPGASGSSGRDTKMEQLAVAQKLVDFTIATSHAPSADALSGVQVDRRVRGGLVALRYERFTLVEIATSTNGPPIIGKLLDPAARAEPVTVNGRPGMWITGAHQIAYLDRSGKFETDTVRRSGPVLLWAGAGVTYRIEGLAPLADAQTVARSIR